MPTINEIFIQLPPDLQREVYNFAQSLLDKQIPSHNHPLTLTWAGGLREYRDQYTSLELQKKALKWWNP